MMTVARPSVIVGQFAIAVSAHLAVVKMVKRADILVQGVAHNAKRGNAV
jgi:hypothetical protein